MTASSERTSLRDRARTLRELESLLAPLEDGPELFQTMLHCAPEDWGTLTGKHYHLGVTDADDFYRSVLTWEVLDDGSVVRVRSGRIGIR